jgi:hypothetical protein
METVVTQSVEERGVVVHQPNDQTTAGRDACVDDGVFDVLRFPGLVGKNEIDLRMFAGARIDFARALGEMVTLRRLVGVGSSSGFGGERDGAEQGEQSEEA